MGSLTNLIRPGPLDVYFRTLDDGELAEVERTFFAGLRLSNGTYKTTSAHRLDDLDELIADLLPRDRRLRVMDVAASSGVTSAEWSDRLRAAGIDHDLIASDLAPSAVLLTVGRRAAALWQEDGHPLAVQLGRGCLYLHGPAALMWAPRTALRLVYELVVRHMRPSAAEAPPVPGRARVRAVPLVSGRLRSRQVRVVPGDIGRPGPNAGLADVCRAANVLNRSYFADRELRTMAAVLVDGLAAGGLLAVCRTDEDRGRPVNRATVLRKLDRSLEVVARLNGGSDVEDVVLAAGARGRSRPERPALVSVVLPVRNGEAHLAAQLSGLAGQTYTGAWELVVVDGGCTDRTIEIVRAFGDRVPSLRVVDARRPPGLGRARNAGAAAARGELLAYCDADDVVEPDWLEALVGAAASADVVGGRCRYDVNDEAQLAWERPAAMTSLADSYGFMPYPPGGNCAVWADVARAVGWDESFEFGASDIEFGWRAQLAGFRLAFEPRAVIQRRFRDTPVAVGRRHFRGAISEPMLYKRFGRHGMRRTRPLRALLAWCRLALTAGRLVTGARDRGRWLRDAGTRTGRLCGSVRHRTLYL